MPTVHKKLNRTAVTALTDGTKEAHIYGVSGEKFYWVESATEPSVEEVKTGIPHNELSVPKGWVIWAVSADGNMSVKVSTASGA